MKNCIYGGEYRHLIVKGSWCPRSLFKATQKAIFNFSSKHVWKLMSMPLKWHPKPIEVGIWESKQSIIWFSKEQVTHATALQERSGRVNISAGVCSPQPGQRRAGPIFPIKRWARERNYYFSSKTRFKPISPQLFQLEMSFTGSVSNGEAQQQGLAGVKGWKGVLSPSA